MRFKSGKGRKEGKDGKKRKTHGSDLLATDMGVFLNTQMLDASSFWAL
jgi:hypothetical protein